MFEVGKTNGIPFYKNKASQRYLAITTSGQVYMAVRKRTTKTISESLLMSPFIVCLININNLGGEGIMLDANLRQGIKRASET